MGQLRGYGGGIAVIFHFTGIAPPPHTMAATPMGDTATAGPCGAWAACTLRNRRRIPPVLSHGPGRDVS